MNPRLILFDVDGTLVDSQASIVAAMTAAFSDAGLDVPARAAILGIVGLSLDHAIARLVPDLGPDLGPAAQTALVSGYKAAWLAQRQEPGASSSPLFPGALEVLERLVARPDTVLGVATGKSRRGLDALLDAHDLGRLFVTRQVADDHPSKPHPSMIETAMMETGIGPAETVMIGDTTFDMDMAAAAGVAGIGVSWGYHPRHRLSGAAHVIDRFEDLPPVLDAILSGAT